MGSGVHGYEEGTSCKYMASAGSKMADHFDEKSGVIPSKTPWGNWAQTIDEVFIEVNVPKGTKGREITCEIKPKSIKFILKGQEFFKVMDLSEPTLISSQYVLFILFPNFAFPYRENSLALFWLMKVHGS